jgi:hypothetical protein
MAEPFALLHQYYIYIKIQYAKIKMLSLGGLFAFCEHSIAEWGMLQ